MRCLHLFLPGFPGSSSGETVRDWRAGWREAWGILPAAGSSSTGRRVQPEPCLRRWRGERIIDVLGIDGLHHAEGVILLLEL